MEFSKRVLIDADSQARPARAFALTAPDIPDLRRLFDLCGIPDDPQELIENGECIGIFVGSELVAACCCVFDANTAKIAALGVAPEYRNQGVAAALAVSAAKRARAERGKRYVTSEIYPKNTYAVRAALRIPFMRISALRLRSGAGLRYILISDALDSRLFSDFKRVPIDDVFAISKLLAHGYVSVSVFTRPEGTFLWLGR